MMQAEHRRIGVSARRRPKTEHEINLPLQERSHYTMHNEDRGPRNGRLSNRDYQSENGMSH
jgi:hypothetical protein